ncbi:MAG: ComEC/Rec2 family competence protein, partial [Pseudomonadota bacterium]
MAGAVATERLEHKSLERAIGPILVEGWVLKAEPARRGVRLVIRTHAIGGVEAIDQPRTVRLTHISYLQTEPGRYVRCWAVLRPPPAPVIEGDYDFDRQAWYGGLGAVGYVQGRCRGGTLGAPRQIGDDLALQLGEARREVARHVHARAGTRAGGFAAALASGDRSLMAPADQDALRGSGLAHLLAISGLHMGIVSRIISLFVWRSLALIEPIAMRVPVKKPAAAIALFACGVYLIMSGASVSTQRAYIMALVFFGAVLLDRTALTQRSLAIAMILIILIAPWSVLTPGFQMSFAATAALIATYEAWRRRRVIQSRGTGPRAIFWLKSLAVTSLVSSLATLPFALFHFNRIAGLGIFANLLAMPIISLISAPAATLALILSPFGWDGPALRVFGLSLEAVLAIAHMLSSDPDKSGLTWPRMPGESLLAFSIGVTVLCLSRSWRLSLGAMLVTSCIGFALWAHAATPRIHWAPSGAVFLESANGAVEKIDWIKGDGLDPLQFSKTPSTRTCPQETRCDVAFNGKTLVLDARPHAEGCAAISQTPRDSVVFAADRACAIAGLASPVGDQGVEPDARSRTRFMGASSAQTITWSEMVQDNGITLEWRAGHFHKRRKLKCGQRPWRPCLHQEADDRLIRTSE